MSAIIFPSELLELPSLRPGLPDDAGIVEIETPVPDPRDIVKCVEYLIRLARSKAVHALTGWPGKWTCAAGPCNAI
jgi:hypothetical protein